MSVLKVTRLDTKVVISKQVVGLPGEAATIDVGDTGQLPPGSPPTVTNVGDQHHAIFEFDIPMGDITPEARQAMEVAQAAQAAAELAETGAQTAQGLAEDARDAASGSAQAALAAQGAAEGASSDASGYATAAGLSAQGATTAQGLAEDARDAAQAAQGLAEDARDAASSSAGTADLAAQAALSSAGTAALAQAGSEAASDISVSASGTATTQAGLAATAKTGAEAARDTAVAAKDTAVSAKDTAVASAGTATTKAGEANLSAIAAAASAGSVTNLTVGSTTTGAPGTDASVANGGTVGAPRLDFTIPRGATGAPGANAAQTLYFDNTASDLLLPSITGTVFAAVNSNPDTITRSSGSFVTDGFVAGMKVTTTGFATGANNGTFVVTIVAANTLTLATIHALTAEAAGATVTIKADRERITRAPAAGTQQDESQSIVLADGDVTIDTYLTPTGYPGALAIPAGTWDFHGWFYVSAGSTTTVKFRVLKIDASGIETTLFTTAASAAIASTSLAAPTEIHASYTVAADIALLTTDRIAVRVVGNNSSTTARVLHFVYQGNTFASHVDTTLPIAGVGVPTGGTSSPMQYLAKKSASDYDTQWRAPLIADVTDLTTSLAAKLASADQAQTGYISLAQPWNASLNAVQGYAAATVQNSYSQTTNAQNNYMEWLTPNLPAGTYTLRMFINKDTTSAIATISIDGVDLGTLVDVYGSGSNVKVDVTGVTLTEGKHLLRFTSKTRNGSSTGWLLTFVGGLWLTRTGV